MSVEHVTVDLLSAYLDEELVERERAQIEKHLEDCTSCQEQLDGLRSVALGLRDVERMAPPPLLEQSIRRQLALVDREVPSWKQPRFVGRLQSNLLLLFALVIALALIAALFADALRRHEANVGSTIVAPIVDDAYQPVDDAGVASAPVAVPGFGKVGTELVETRAGAVEAWWDAQRLVEYLGARPELLAAIREHRIESLRVLDPETGRTVGGAGEELTRALERLP